MTTETVAPTATALPITLHIDLEAYNAVARCASSEESRPILQGVHCDPAGHLVATDGHALLVWPFAITAEQLDPTTNRATPCAIPAGVILDPGTGASKLSKNGTGVLEVTLPLVGAPRQSHADVVRFVRGKTLDRLVCGLIEGPFPNWRQVVSRPDALNPTTPHQQLDPALLAKFELPRYNEKGKPAGIHRATITPCGPGRALLVTYADCSAVGVIMPRRADDATPTVPGWVHA